MSITLTDTVFRMQLTMEQPSRYRYYTFGPQEWFLDKEKLKQGYDEITAELDADQKRLVEKRVQAWKVFLKHPERIQTLAKDIAEDFRSVVEPQGYKAQVVACDKEACVLYYKLN